MTDLYDLGCTPGADIAPIVNAFLTSTACPPGTSIFIPALEGDTLSNSWVVGSTIVAQSGIYFRGSGYGSGARGSVLRRTGAFPLFNISGTGGGSSAAEMLVRGGLYDLVLHGGDYDHDLVLMGYVGNYTLSGNAFKAMGDSRALYVYAQTQDCWIERNYFTNGGTASGSVATVEIDDSSGGDGHNQNLNFLFNVWEAYNGRALKAYGKGSGPGNTLQRHFGSKFESPTRSNVADIELVDCSGFDFVACFVASKGTSGGSKPAIFLLTRSPKNNLDFYVGHQSGGAALGCLATLTASPNCNVTFRISDANTVDNLTGAAVIDADAASTTGRFSVSYIGVAGAQKLVSTNPQRDLATQRQIRVSTVEAIFMRLVRTIANGTVQNAARLIELINGSGSAYVGADANNHWAGGDVADITGAPRWRLNSADGSLYAKGGLYVGGELTGGAPSGPKIISGAGSPEGLVSAPKASMYLRLDGGPLTTLYVKEDGSGSTGWAAK